MSSRTLSLEGEGRVRVIGTHRFPVKGRATSPQLAHRRGERIFLAAALLLVSCRGEAPASPFPEARRDVAPVVGDAFSTEDVRDRLGEAEEVIGLAEVKPGMSVADVGAGEGYYTVRLARAVGPKGRVLAEASVPRGRAARSERVQREQLDNVAVKLGTPDNPMLPRESFDRIFLVHMYHEVQSPYAFLWHLREGLKPDGLVVVVDSDRRIKQHGIRPGQVTCEFRGVGLEPVKSSELTGGESYFMAFRIARPRPAPGAIRRC